MRVVDKLVSERSGPIAGVDERGCVREASEHGVIHCVSALGAIKNELGPIEVLEFSPADPALAGELGSTLRLSIRMAAPLR